MENGNRNLIHTGVIIFVTAVLLWMACGRPGTAEAAYTTDGTYYPDMMEVESEMTTFGDFKTSALDTCEHFFVLKNSDTEYTLGFIDSDVIGNVGELFERSSDHNYVLGCSYLFSVVYDTGRGSWVCGSVSGNGKGFLVSIGSKDSGFRLVGTSFPILERCLQVIRDVAGVELQHDNLSFPGSGGGDVLTVPLLDTYVDVPMGNHRYYLVLYDANKYDSDAVESYTRVFLSDEPLQGYVENGAVILRADKKIVAYGMSSKTSASDYLASPGVYHSSSTALSTNGYSDYASNYDLSYNGKVYLPAKPYSPPPEETYPDASALYSAFTEEMLAYKHCIILRQPHEDALTNDVVCYLWNDSKADLIIRWGDSCIAAARNGVEVTDYLKARYDLKTGRWEADSKTYISRCKNDVYNVPYIYYSSAPLYLQMPGNIGWYAGDICVFSASLEAPPYNPDVPGGEDYNPFEQEEGFSTGIDWLDKLLDGIGKLFSLAFDGLGKLFSRLFVPSSSYFKNKVDALKQKFCFWESITKTAEVFLNFFENTDFSEPPKITVNLSSATSKYDYGTSATFLDLSWYKPYKKMVDALLSAVMWAVFAWNTFKNLPGILSGIVTSSNVDTRIILPSGPDRIGGSRQGRIGRRKD